MVPRKSRDTTTGPKPVEWTHRNTCRRTGSQNSPKTWLSQEHLPGPERKITAPSRQASPCPTWTSDIHCHSVSERKNWQRAWWIAITEGRKRHQISCRRAGPEDYTQDKPMHKVQLPEWTSPPIRDAPGSKPTGEPQTSQGTSIITAALICNTPCPLTSSVRQYFPLFFSLLCNTTLPVTPTVSGVSWYHRALCKALRDALGCQQLHTSKSLTLLAHCLQMVVARRQISYLETWKEATISGPVRGSLKSFCWL